MIFGMKAVLKLWGQFFEALRLVSTRGTPRRGAKSGTLAEAPLEPVLQRESVNLTAPASTPVVTLTAPAVAPVEWRSKNLPVQRNRQRKWQKDRKSERRTTPPRKRGRRASPSHLSFRELLPIDTLIPADIDVKCAQALLLWGFMRPAQEKKLVNGSYGNLESIFDAVVGKGYPQDSVRQAMYWFTKMGVIICPHPVGGKKILSLSTRTNTALSPNAKKIITIVARALYRLECLKHGKNPATTA